MRKRFTDADKWRDPWFSALAPMAKLFWMFLCDSCDNAGVWEIDHRRVRYELGDDVDVPALLRAFGDRVRRIGDHRLLLVKFVEFQHPRGLNPKAPAQLSIANLLRKYGLPIPWSDGIAVPSQMGSASQQVEVKVKVEVEDKVEAADPQDLTSPLPPAPVRIVQNVRPPVSDLDHLRHAGAMIGREEAGAWQLLVDDRGLEPVKAAVLRVVAAGKPGFRSHVAESLGVAKSGAATPKFIIVDGEQIPVVPRS